jgi:hypothetical protein
MQTCVSQDWLCHAAVTKSPKCKPQGFNSHTAFWCGWAQDCVLLFSVIQAEQSVPWAAGHCATENTKSCMTYSLLLLCSLQCLKLVGHIKKIMSQKSQPWLESVPLAVKKMFSWSKELCSKMILATVYILSVQIWRDIKNLNVASSLLQTWGPWSQRKHS